MVASYLSKTAPRPAFATTLRSPVSGSCVRGRKTTAMNYSTEDASGTRCVLVWSDPFVSQGHPRHNVCNRTKVVRKLFVLIVNRTGAPCFFLFCKQGKTIQSRKIESFLFNPQTRDKKLSSVYNMASVSFFKRVQILLYLYATIRNQSCNQ